MTAALKRRSGRWKGVGEQRTMVGERLVVPVSSMKALKLVSNPWHGHGVGKMERVRESTRCCSEGTINSVLPPEILALILQRLHKRSDCRAASRVCYRWFEVMARLELQRRRSVSHRCLHSARGFRRNSQPGISPCSGKRVVETVAPSTSRLSLAAALLRVCQKHTSALVIKDVSKLSFSDYQLIGYFGTGLTGLALHECHSLDLQGLVAVLGNCVALRSVRMTVASGLNDVAAEELVRKCRQLEEVHLYGCYGMTAASLLSILLGCPNLKELQLKGMSLAATGAWTAALPRVPAGPSWKLKVLTLTGSGCITDEVLESIQPRLAHLQQLDLTNCFRVTDVGVASIVQGCQGTLKKLKLKGCAISDATLLQMASTDVKMVTLSVSSDEVTDDGLRALVNSKGSSASLRQLCLSSSRVTDDGLAHLAKQRKKMSRFKVIDVQNCPDISVKGPRALRCKGSERMAVVSDYRL